MWGDSLRAWFELFAGVTVYRVTQTGPDNDDGWINITVFEERFARERLLFGGLRYDPADSRQQNALFNAIIENASALCHVGLLERKRNLNPPSLDYRLTRFGRRVDALGYGQDPGIRKRLLFVGIIAYFRVQRYWKLIAIGAAGWAVLNAVRFYWAAFEWANGNVFALVSAAITALVLALFAFVKAHLESH